LRESLQIPLFLEQMATNATERGGTVFAQRGGNRSRQSDTIEAILVQDDTQDHSTCGVTNGRENKSEKKAGALPAAVPPNAVYEGRVEESDKGSRHRPAQAEEAIGVR
jgi:hypothetical protein